jgi:hypothetical protein
MWRPLSDVSRGRRILVAYTDDRHFQANGAPRRTRKNMPVPDELDSIRERLTALENRMESESGLRAMMDLDQASLTVRLDAQDNLLRALAITQSDHTSRLTRLEDSQRRQGEALGRVEAGIRDILALLQGNEPGGGTDQP